MPVQQVTRPEPAAAGSARSSAAVGVAVVRSEAGREPACWRRGLAQARAQDWAAASRSFKTAARQMPGDPECWLLLANALRKCGDLKGAVEAASKALEIEPQHRLARTLKHACLKAARRTQDLQRWLSETPEHLLDRQGWLDLIEARLRLGRPLDAVRACLQAVSRCPHDAMLNYWMGIGFADMGLKAQAAECLRTALSLDLGHFEVGVRDLLAYFERQVCEWGAAEKQLARLVRSIEALAPGQPVCASPFTHVTLLDDPAAQLQAARAHALYIEAGTAMLPCRQPAQSDRLRLGYVSADFHRHATSYLMAELLECHDRSRFEVFLYSLGRDDGSELRTRIQASGSLLVEARDMTPTELAQRIRSDGIDILVDLKGYTRDAQPAVFAHRPAPVQVAYLGYPGTSGASYMDYIVGDPWVTPLDSARHYAEKIAQMPGCYQCNDGTRAVPVPACRADHGLAEEGFVLCGFNESYKISPEVFDVWCRVLNRVPNAVLWLLECNADSKAALRREAGSRGVDPDRLVFAPKIDNAAHLRRVACADLFLDTWPCNGHTTVSDMLWCGVPVVTYSGRTFASRVAGSLLHAVGLPELVCSDASAYERLVQDLAVDRARLAELRQRVRDARSQAEVFSGAAAARHLEALFERMWARALDGLPPEHLAARSS
jgi:predicted O-linked N-acetylglucosamine transferase (SPINDLY family)